MGHQQVYLFGGDGTAKQLQIYPLNAPGSNDFSQIMRVNLQSGELSYETSTPYFINAARSPISSDVVYFDKDRGLRHYDPANKTHITISLTNDVTGISVTEENDWVYISNQITVLKLSIESNLMVAIKKIYPPVRSME